MQKVFLKAGDAFPTPGIQGGNVLSSTPEITGASEPQGMQRGTGEYVSGRVGGPGRALEKGGPPADPEYAREMGTTSTRRIA